MGFVDDAADAAATAGATTDDVATVAGATTDDVAAAAGATTDDAADDADGLAATTEYNIVLYSSEPNPSN